MEFLSHSQFSETPNISDDIWELGRIRLFLSHKSADSETARELKDSLRKYGVTSFVAHEDVDPTEEWENVILGALSTMDMLVVLLTEDASHSHWVDQEIGYAMGSNTPVVTIRLGADPFGFVAKFQAISGQGKSNYDIARELFSLMLVKNRLRLRDQAKDALILAFRHALSFDDAANLGTFLPSIDALTPEQMDNLVHAYNNNYQCYQCFRLQESIVPNLNRLSSNGITYEFDEHHQITVHSYNNAYGSGGYGVIQSSPYDDLPWPQ